MSTADGTGAPNPVATGVQLTALDPVFRERFNEVLHDLRTREPVHQDRMFDRVVLTRAEDVAAALNDRTLHADPERARPNSYVRKQLGLSGANRVSFLHMDDPSHRRVRGLVAKAFSQRAVEDVRPQVQAVAQELLDRIAPGEPFDVVEAYAAPLPTTIIATLLGVDPADQAEFKRWSEALALTLNPRRTDSETTTLIEAAIGLRTYLLRAVAQRRQQRTDDLISHLVAAEEDQERLSEAEIVDACILLLSAGNLTTTDLIGNAVKALLDHPQQAAEVRAQPDRMAAAIEETLRYDTPVMTATRTAPAAGHQVGGCPVQPGQTLSLLLAAANRDPALHGEPDRFDPDRAGQRHFSFGGGMHFCLGASLARLEGQVAVGALFARFPKLRLLPGRPPLRRVLPALNGFAALWVAPE